MLISEKQPATIMFIGGVPTDFHILKTVNPYFSLVNLDKKEQRKTLELRLFDRDYKVGDYLILREYNQSTGIYGNYCVRLITNIITDYSEALKPGYCALSIMKLSKQKDELLRECFECYLFFTDRKRRKK